MPGKAKAPNAAVLAARARRSQNAAAKQAKVEWFINNVSGKIAMTLKQRMDLATEHLKTQVVKNISVPVGKSVSGGGRNSQGRFLARKVRVTERSKPGEYPRADTTLLMKSIFGMVQKNKAGNWVGYVGTTLGYGAILEMSTKLDRSYLRRTHTEELPTIRRILAGPISKVA